MKLFNNFNKHEICGLPLELRSIYLKEFFDNSNKSLLLVCNSLYEANKFYQLLSSFDNVLFFPMDDFLTSEALASSPELMVKRLETINELLTVNKYIVITNLMGLLRYLPSRELFIDKQIKLKVNQEINMDMLKKKLFDLGYRKEVIVTKTGEMALRGFVIDIFPISYNNPIRIEFWGDSIDKISEFDIDSQLTIKDLDEININSITEFLTNSEVETFNRKHRDLIKYEKVYSILDLVNGDLFYNDFDSIKVGYDNIIEEIKSYALSEDISLQTKFMFDLNDFDNKYNPYYFNRFDSSMNDKSISYKAFSLDKFGNDKDSINGDLNSYLRKYSKVYIVCKNLKNYNKITNYLENPNIVLSNKNDYIPNKINVYIDSLAKGFIFNDEVYISDNDILSYSTDDNKYRSKFKLGSKIKDITKLNRGDYVVHSSHGIGRYLGIKSLKKGDLIKDYLLIEYRDGDKLYIPVEKIDSISKFSSKEGVVPKLNKLGTTEWEKTKLKARKKIEDIAADLLRLYALREATQGFAFAPDTKEQYEFEKEFDYIETADQIKVINEIKKDMESKSPMDRLLCGDVGYGKTEVAFRAIFKAIMNNKQAAILCPTTILSNQHYNNAIKRFSSFPVTIELINRFVTPAKMKNILQRVKEGKVDLLIGTHRLLSDDVQFKDLGLLVIDEEQRFGVKHKEKIKDYKNNVDVLTLSATPIPRTLQMSMSGLRSLSLIETPPVDRYPIQTYVLSENKAIIKDAIYKELSRGGQCFILFNNIAQIEDKKTELSEICPDAKIVCAHGRMTKEELESIMIDFNEHKFDILLCTTIIETGIDIPNVNTLIIYDADHFGLSQLYQIRGRVGRSNKIAYCYLMYNKQKILSEIAVKRLNTIKEFTELGSGFAIAMRDLAIRGAGDLLGSEQAGFIDTVGIELFMQMLEEEVAKLKGEEVKAEEDDNSNPVVDISTSIDDNYVMDEELKIEIHKKINAIDSKEKLEEVKSELENRFGKLSDEMLIYMHEEWLEKLSDEIGIKNVKQTKNSIDVYIPKQVLEGMDGRKLFFEISDLSRMFRFSKKFDNLVITLDTVKLDKHFVYYLIDLFLIIKKIKVN